MNFKQFIINEADPPMGAPPMGSPPMGGGMGGGMPPMGGGGLPGGGMPPMGGGMGGGMPPGPMPGADPLGGGMGMQPPAQNKPLEIEFLDVWTVLEKLIEEKPEEDKNKSRQSNNSMVKDNTSQKHLLR